MSGYRLLPKRDRLGREQRDLHQLGDGATLTILCARAGMPLKRVPGAAWALDADEDGQPTAIVSCPCGATHLLPLLEGPQGDTDTNCQRGYWFDGKNVWVLNSPPVVSA